MMKVEAKVDQGQLRLRDEVGGDWLACVRVWVQLEYVFGAVWGRREERQVVPTT
jgi:hypothetical protein